MTSVNSDSAARLASQPHTPIAQLNPDLPDQASRVVRGEITITWPYSSVNKTFAFLLAESDVRLRRARGQVRIELRGPSAKAASECGLGAGDELLFSLEGVVWAKDESPGRIPGARVEWQLQFSEKLILQAKSGESGEIKHINIDHDAAQSADGSVPEPPKAATPEEGSATLEVQSAVRKISEFPANEYPSPAFVKRARLSYGALFEGGFDMFEEDGGVRGKGRKRTRFEHGRSAWRYASQSPSPEPTSPIHDEAGEDASADVTPQPSPKPHTTDEGYQTIDTEMTEAAPEPVKAAGAQPAQTSTLASQEGPTAPMQEGEVTMRQVEDDPRILTPEKKSVLVVEEGQVRKESVMATQPTTVGEPRGRSVEEYAQDGNAQEQPITETSRSSPPTAKAKSTPVGDPWPLGSNFSMFGTSAPVRVESALSLADQVRFGFSHVPQTTRSSSPPRPEHDHQPNDQEKDPYPVSYLNEEPASGKFADMNTCTNAADEQSEMTAHGQPVAIEPPTVERFGQGQWEMSTQCPHYNPVEGGHFGTDTLEEGARVIAGHVSPPTTGVVTQKVPEAFASYGHGNLPESDQDNPQPERPSHEDQPLVENDEMISEDEAGDDEEEEEDANYDEYAYGQQLEEGDYDQRTYEIPDDDDEGLSEEEDEVELDTEERYGNAETYDEVGEGEEWDEDGEEGEEEEDEYESGEEDYEEDYDLGRYRPRKAAAPAPAGEPVIISLLSDSEDEDEDEDGPAPPLSKPAAATPPAPVQHPPPPITFRKASRPTPPERSPRISKTLESDSDVKEPEPTPNNIFSQTQVVDFAERLNQGGSQHSTGPAAEAGAATEGATFTSQAPGSFEVSNARGESAPPQSEPAPSEGSSEGLFVSQSKPQPEPETEPEPAPSETSSQGLFVSQPRTRSPAAHDADFREDGEEPNEGRTHGDMEWDQEQTRSTGDSMSLEEIEENDMTQQARSRGNSMSVEDMEQAGSRGESMSVEEVDEEGRSRQAGSRGESMSVEEAGECETTSRPVKTQDDTLSLPDADDASFASQVEMEDVVESEDEHMSTADDPSKDTVTVEEAWSTIEVEEVTISEMDVDMLDAGSPLVESASSLMMASQSPQQGTSAETAASGSDFMVSEVVSEAAVPISSDEPIPSSEISAGQEAEPPITTANEQGPAEAERLQETPGKTLKAQAEVSATGADNSEAPENQEKIKPTHSDVNEAPMEAHEGVAADTKSANATPSVGSPELGEDDSPEDQASELPSQTGQDEAEAAAERAGESAQQTLEPELAPQATSPEADVDDETMILEQLTQESLDISVSLAREALASPSKRTQGLQVQEAEPPEAQIPDQSSSPDPSASLAREALASPSKHTQELQESAEAEAAEPQVRTRSPSPDSSAELARAAVASASKRGARRQKKAPEPIRTSPPVTRGRSSSLRSDTTAETSEDLSVSLAREALASPSRRDANPTATTAATLKSELTKRLRTELPECIPLKSLRTYVDKFPNAVVVVTSQPSTPTRAKGGPREYFMSFHVTDPSTAPSQVVEVQLYRPHKDSLPIVKPGDAILLQKFQVKALSKKGFGLRTGVESAWAVWDDGADGDGGAPQIKGPPVEGWGTYVPYVKTLREWFGLLVADEAAKAKLEKADRKLAEGAGAGGK